MYCKNCGQEAKEQYKFCPNCGTRLAAKEEDSNTFKAFQEMERNRKKKMVIGVAVAIVLVLLCTFLFINPNSSDTELSETNNSSTKLTGTWVCEKSISGYPDIMILDEDGRAVVDGSTSFIWETEGSTFRIKWTAGWGETGEYEYKIRGGKLYLDGIEYTKRK